MRRVLKKKGKMPWCSQEEFWTQMVWTRMCRDFSVAKMVDGGGAQMDQ